MAASGIGSGGGIRLQSEINVTPLVDVVLVLLIIFMVIIPLTLRGYDVAIPGQASSPAVAPPVEEQVVLTVDGDDCPVFSPPDGDGLPADCRVRVNDDRIPADALAATVATAFDGRDESDRVLFLAVDPELNYEAVLRIVDAARSQTEGLRVGFVTGVPSD